LCAGLTGEEKEEGARAKEGLELDQGEDGEDGGNYKAQNQFHTHLKKQTVTPSLLAIPHLVVRTT
jgi:hypothetical protein